MASALNPLTGRGMAGKRTQQAKEKKKQKRRKPSEYIPPQTPIESNTADEAHPQESVNEPALSTDIAEPQKQPPANATFVDQAAILDEQTETVDAPPTAKATAAGTAAGTAAPDEDAAGQTKSATFVAFESAEEDPRHKAALEQMEKGDWPKATAMLQQLTADYPNDSGLQLLLAEAEFKTELDNDWGDTVKGRKHTISPLRLVAKLTVVLGALAVIGGGLYFYYGIVLPNQAASEVAAEFQARVDQADYALQAGQYEKAVSYYEALIAKEPAVPTFRSGLNKAKKQLGLEQEYGAAMAVLAEGDTDQAIEMLTTLESKAPGYKDVASQLALLNSEGEVTEILKMANLAYDFKKWDQAATLFDQVREMDGELDAVAVTERLIESSRNAGLQLVSVRPESMAEIETAEDFFRKVLTLRVSDEAAKAESTLLTTFVAGQRAMDMGSLEQGLAILEPLYAERPGYLGGYLAQLLFDAYMIVGDKYMIDGDRFEAFGFFSKAADLEGVDTGEANLRLEGLEVLLTPTPTPTNTPTPAPILPTATPAPLDMYAGWIGFKSNKDGGTGLFVMKPDGTGMRSVSANSWEIFDRIYEAESWSPDATTRVYAEKGPSGAVNLYKMRHDLPENWDRRLMITDFPGDDYDGKWSPTNDRIVFVSNHTGNDEIWTVKVDDEKEHRQLTHNDWEWDKHPSWSPDGSHIIFYSNRSGMKQLWIMRADGTEQVQLTDGQYDYWDPIWIKPGYLAPPE